MAKRTTRQRRGYGWTWEFKPTNEDGWHMCHFAMASKAGLESDDWGKPSDDARAVRVEFVPTSERDRKRYGYS